jgi:hypothetical protein
MNTRGVAILAVSLALGLIPSTTTTTGQAFVQLSPVSQEAMRRRTLNPSSTTL